MTDLKSEDNHQRSGFIEEIIGNYKFLLGLGGLSFLVCSGAGLGDYLSDTAKAKVIAEQNASGYVLKTQNILGGSAPEEFYEINGKKVYLRIDGALVEELYKQKN